MRLVTIDDGRPADRRAGSLTDDGIVDLAVAWPEGPRTVLEILRQGCLDDLKALDLSAVPRAARLPADAPLWAPVDRPGKILALGLNSRGHCAENDKPVPEIPIVFEKAVTALSAQGRDIVIPPGTDMLDWEVELCAVVGRRAKAVAVADAMDYIAGYTVVNDVSARDWQFAVSQWHRAKSGDTFAPMGPALVTLDEAGPWQEKRLVCRVSGDVMQDALAGEDMIFSPAEVLSFISQSETLEPGDCISLGTPAGVGYYTTPRRFLRPGDVVECDVSGIGLLRNPVVAG